MPVVGVHHKHAWTSPHNPASQNRHTCTLPSGVVALLCLVSMTDLHMLLPVTARLHVGGFAGHCTGQ